MAVDPPADNGMTGALEPLAPGEILTVRNENIVLMVAPHAGGRIAQIEFRGTHFLVGYTPSLSAMIAWGCYPMLPWAGRIRHGRFSFKGADYQLPLNLGEHAIHGIGFGLPWQAERQGNDLLELSITLPSDDRWPFGGKARQRIAVEGNALNLELSLQAGDKAMPAAIGWHPWFRKPERFEFSPEKIYPRDSDGIAITPCVEPTPGPWDDCFINTDPIVLDYPQTSVRVTSDCVHWVVYDETDYATCVEPQSGPPDSFNLEPLVLEPGEVLKRSCRIEFLQKSV